MYVHLKDFKIYPKGSSEGRFFEKADCNLKSSIIGEGDVDISNCLDLFKKANYNGFYAIEYGGGVDGLKGIEKSIENIRRYN